MLRGRVVGCKGLDCSRRSPIVVGRWWRRRRRRGCVALAVPPGCEGRWLAITRLESGSVMSRSSRNMPAQLGWRKGLRSSGPAGMSPGEVVRVKKGVGQLCDLAGQG